MPSPYDVRTVAPSAAAARIAPPVISLDRLAADPSLRLTTTGRLLLRLLHAQAEGFSDQERLVRAVPPHRAVAVSRIARDNAASWLRLAEELELADRLLEDAAPAPRRAADVEAS
jgi:hypothetical protein